MLESEIYSQQEIQQLIYSKKEEIPNQIGPRSKISISAPTNIKEQESIIFILDTQNPNLIYQLQDRLDPLFPQQQIAIYTTSQLTQQINQTKEYNLIQSENLNNVLISAIEISQLENENINTQLAEKLAQTQQEDPEQSRSDSEEKKEEDRPSKRQRTQQTQRPSLREAANSNIAEILSRGPSQSPNPTQQSPERKTSR
jgi:hypothetical protein